MRKSVLTHELSARPGAQLRYSSPGCFWRWLRRVMVAAMPGRVQRDVLARGVRLRVVEEGAGPALLLLHGLYMDHSTWDELGAALGDDFHKVAPDLPGFGVSEKPPPHRFAYDVETIAEAIVDLYAGVGLGPAAIVGHGLGGAVAIAIAARHAELCSRLVLVDAICHSNDPDVATRLASLPFVGSFVLKQLWGRSAFRAFFKRAILSSASRTPDARIDYYYDHYNTPAARGSALAVLRAMNDTRSVVANLTRIETPTLVVWGRADRLRPLALGQRLAREIRGAQLEVLEAGHAPQEECPAELARVIRRFISGKRELSTPRPQG
jgi:pimeloyl-ACP methyl ester carboxylesterase